jgi:hypothetical protein
MKGESFRAAASRVIGEGSRERRATAKRLALQFEMGADEFDLRLLERLGEDGLAAFLSYLGHQNPFPNRREREPTPRVQSSAGSEPGGTSAGRFCEAANPGGSSELSCVDGLRVSALSSSARSFSKL